MKDLTVRQQQQAIESAVNCWLWDNPGLVKEAVTTAVSVAMRDWLSDHGDEIRAAITEIIRQAVRF